MLPCLDSHTTILPLLYTVCRFVVPVMMGFVRQLPGLSLSGQGGTLVVGALTLIARRSTLRIGTRHWRRGADAEGVCVAQSCVVSLGNLAAGWV